MSAHRRPAFAFHHVQLAMPPGAEAAARAFYAGVLGLAEIAKPPALTGRGGVWFRAGALELHLGVEDDFRPARKAHPGILVEDLDGLAAQLQAHDIQLRPDTNFPGYRRFYLDDCFGNRLEFLSPANDAQTHADPVMPTKSPAAREPSAHRFSTSAGTRPSASTRSNFRDDRNVARGRLRLDVAGRSPLERDGGRDRGERCEDEYHPERGVERVRRRQSARRWVGRARDLADLLLVSANGPSEIRTLPSRTRTAASAIFMHYPQ